MATAQGEKVLNYLAENGPVDTLTLAQLWEEDHQKIVGTIKSLICLGDVSLPRQLLHVHADAFFLCPTISIAY